ncbi:MAG: polyphosphate polymerase domain-containing protein [Clostridia bacterium]|nr:polyphosphate polymerase domain-containing protein [Clostridia bacterium]MBR6890590.1 polyphosphate polymerase domain-containing protein [Clostridia bacterium]
MQQKRNALPARHELKYFINPAELKALRARLRGALAMDRHCEGGRPYAIRSLYFDDIGDSALFEKQAGVMHRDKYRIRIYNLSDKAIFLERKRKAGDLIQKSSVQITRRLCDQLIDGNPAGLYKANSPLLQDMYVQMRTRLLRPRVIVDYAREAYVHPAEEVRITFDLALRSGLFSRDLFNPNLPTVCPHDRNVEILEVKFNDYLPDYIAALLGGVDAERSAVSKYILCRRYEP